MKTIYLAAIGILLANLLALLNPSNANAQKQTPRSIVINDNSHGFYEYLPKGYDTETQTYPLMVFLHGIGELGDGSAGSLPTVLRNGPPKLINDGTFPVSFTVNGETFKFIVISPQFINWPVADDIQAVMDYAVKNYRVNTSRIYLTGLSMGGGVTWDYATLNSTYANRIAALVPVCGASGPTPDKVKVLASSNLPVWATHNQDDGSVPSSNTISYVDDINAYTPEISIPARKTIFPASGHDAWSTTYSTDFKENNMNVYEWMLQYQRGSGQPGKPAPPPPAAVAIPGNVEAENYTSMKGVQSENTIDTNGGQDIGFIDTGDWMDYKVNVTSAGSYSADFRVAGNAGQLQVLNAQGAVLTTLDVPQTGDYQKWITISTKLDLPAGTQVLRVNCTKGGWNFNWVNFTSAVQVSKGAAIPGKIEAETYSAMNGIGTEATSDAGGGKNVGWIATGDWMDYEVTVATAGNFTVNFRVATSLNKQQLQLRSSSGSVLGTLTVPQTGGYQTWTTASIAVSLPAGNQTLRIYSLEGSYNINWFEFVAVSTTANANIEQIISTDADLRTKENFAIFPNPIKERFSLQLNNNQTGTVDVRITDQSGKVIKTFKFEKDQQVSQLNVTASDLIPGIYFMKVQIGSWSESKKLIKM